MEITRIVVILLATIKNEKTTDIQYNIIIPNFIV